MTNKEAISFLKESYEIRLRERAFYRMNEAPYIVYTDGPVKNEKLLRQYMEKIRKENSILHPDKPPKFTFYKY